MAGLLSRDIEDEDVVKEEIREKFKVISNGELRVELGGVGVDLVLNVDFEVTNTEWILDTDWKRQLKAGEISSDELVRLATHQNNIVKEIQVTLRVIKT